MNSFYQIQSAQLKPMNIGNLHIHTGSNSNNHRNNDNDNIGNSRIYKHDSANSH